MLFSVARRALRMEYVLWRITHGLMAAIAMIMVMTHAYMVGNHIGTPLKQGLWLGYGAVSVLVVAYLRLFKPWQMLRRPYHVVEVRPQHGSVWSLVLEPVNHEGLRFEAGQFAWLTAWRSPFAAHEHPFSFSSSSEDTDTIEFAIKELGDFTATIGRLEAGQHVYVDGPYGSFVPDRYDDYDALVLIAGGVGIAPIMSILRSMADRGDTTPTTLLYGSQSWELASFREQLTELEKVLDLKVIHVLERPPEDWEGEVGYVTRDMLERYLPDPSRNYRVFLCGPTGMLNAVEESLQDVGVPESNIHLERFDLA
jgi:predicted ferric reductase